MSAFRDLGRFLLLCVGVRVLLAHLAARFDARLERMAREASEPGWDGGHVVIVTPIYDQDGEASGA